MKDEIKEILDIIKKVSKAEVNSYNGLIETPPMKWEILYDYITNLQEENERLKNGYCELKVKCNNGEYDCTNEEYDSMVKANMKGSLLLDDYKSRNEKAIEYINNNMPYLQEVDEEFENVDGEVYFTYKEWNGTDLLNILQGSEEK